MFPLFDTTTCRFLIGNRRAAESNDEDLRPAKRRKILQADSHNDLDAGDDVPMVQSMSCDSSMGDTTPMECDSDDQAVSRSISDYLQVCSPTMNFVADCC